MGSRNLHQESAEIMVEQEGNCCSHRDIECEHCFLLMQRCMFDDFGEKSSRRVDLAKQFLKEAK